MELRWNLCRINEWLDKQKAEEEDRARKKKEKLEKILNPPRHILNDSSYVSEIRATADKVDDALKQGKYDANGFKMREKQNFLQY